MKKTLRLIFTVMFAMFFFTQPSSAFTNGSWTSVPGYEVRQDYHIDQEEALRYLTEMYYKLTNAQETRATVENKFRKLMSEDGKPFLPKQAMTKGTLSNIIYATIAEAFPGRPLTADIPRNYTETVDERTAAALQFMLSRELCSVKEDGSFGIGETLTLGETIEILDCTLASAPNFDEVLPIPEPEIVEIKPEVPLPEKTAYLSFDDSVSENTLKILDILKEKNIKAVFFIAGKGDADIIRRIDAEGHIIGNHGMSHDYSKIYTSSEAFWTDIEEEAVYLEEILGYRPTLMRFPGGSNNSVSKKYFKDHYLMDDLVLQAQEHGYIYMDWNCSNGDAQAALVPTQTLIFNANKTAVGKDRIILLMHQTKAKTTTPTALPTIIDNLQKAGYVFRTPNPDEFNYQFIKPVSK